MLPYSEGRCLEMWAERRHRSSCAREQESDGGLCIPAGTLVVQLVPLCALWEEGQEKGQVSQSQLATLEVLSLPFLGKEIKTQTGSVATEAASKELVPTGTPQRSPLWSQCPRLPPPLRNLSTGSFCPADCLF